jgi:hypothetical protein
MRSVHRVKLWEQFLLQLVSPVVGTALIGSLAAVLARRYQDRRLDRQIRMDLVSRVSEVVCAIHTMLSFYERWVRHSRPAPDDHEARRAEVDRDFIGQRSKLNVLQTETDAYFGQASVPGILLHQLADLTMLRYAIILGLPRSQVTEMIDHLGRPGHSGFSVEELEAFMNTPKPSGTQVWLPTAAIEESFTKALHDTVHAILATRPVRAAEGFVSGKLLTAYDQDGSLTGERQRRRSTTAV